MALRQLYDQRHEELFVVDLAVAYPIVLPESWVEQEIRSRLEDLARNLVMQGVDPEQAKIDWKEVWQKQEAPARKTVHARLILDAVATILFMDEGTSALDGKSERLILRPLKESSKDRTLVSIQHHPPDEKMYDKIIIVHSGTVVEEGTRQELLDLNGYFAEMVGSEDYNEL